MTWLGRAPGDEPTERERAEMLEELNRIRAEVAAMPPPTAEEVAAHREKWADVDPAARWAEQQAWKAAHGVDYSMSTREAREMLGRYDDDQDAGIVERHLAEQLDQDAAPPPAETDDEEWRAFLDGHSQDDTAGDEPDSVGEAWSPEGQDRDLRRTSSEAAMWAAAAAAHAATAATRTDDDQGSSSGSGSATGDDDGMVDE